MQRHDSWGVTLGCVLHKEAGTKKQDKAKTVSQKEHDSS